MKRGSASNLHCSLYEETGLRVAGAEELSQRAKVTAEELWDLNRDTADACLAHPFVRGMGSGDLSLERFRAYVAQDA